MTVLPRWRARMRAARPLALAVVALAAVFGSFVLWRHARDVPTREAPPPAPPLTVAATVARTGMESVTLDAIGTLAAVRQVTLAPEVAGRVTGIDFEPGTAVAEGARLVQLYDAPERARLASLQARAAYAKTQLQRSQTLVPMGAESRRALDEHRFDFAATTADARQVQAVITQKSVRAPFSGEIGLRRVNVGQYVNAGDPIATLTDLDTLHVNFALPQKHLGQLRPGSRVRVATDAFPGRLFDARVTALEPHVDERTRNVSVQATLSNPNHLLRPGMYAQVRLELPPRHDVLTVPDTAVQTSQDGETVAVVEHADRNGVGTVAIRRIETGARRDDRVAVLDGLRPGEVIVTSGQLRVAPGMRVKIALDGATPPERPQ